MQVKFLRVHKDAVMPEYQTGGAAAFDFALIEDVVIEPTQIAKVRTGLVIQTPRDHALIIASRSSNPIKKGIDLANSIGVVDSDFAGPNDEIHILLINITNAPVTLKAGDRVAQGLIIPVVRAQFEEAASIDGASRGGFGSTGN